ncbi:uncharacterized protein PV09_02974 [Verruconis gallopava]|uniref:Amino acid permease/ SLC12A domain-containing protein n=1 Tax=Verruconis gallopava TaxID=253628 RepID=A0A0D2B5R0_9PEZI|nr:uncharacterized protein PV09_02974 [Verruconis gallopava]KIW06544.1 hypothetical protein PV09_02974 [Verruconis gallopava]
MAWEPSSRMARSSLSPDSIRQFQRAPGYKSRSRSPAGTRASNQKTKRESFGPEIYVQQDDNSPAEQHELDDIVTRTTYLPGMEHAPNISKFVEPNDSDPKSNSNWLPKPKKYVDQLDLRDNSPARTETYESDELQYSNGGRHYPESVWSESHTNVPRRNLTAFDVAALIFNKMVGTGIFTTPGAVLSLTGSKQLSIGLWAVGGVYTFICLFIYLEYGSALPFTGGELIYLDEVFYWPQLLATMLASSFFLILWNSSPNSFAFAKHVLLASIPTANSSQDFDPRLIRFIAFSILTTICLLHYFSSKLGLFLNKVLALFKACLLLSIFIAGMVATRKPNSGTIDWSVKHGPKGKTNGADSIAAFVLILYSYTGWENANYVAGEIKAPNKMLKQGAFLAVGAVTFLYIMVSAAYYAACKYTAITSLETDLGMAVIFAPVAFGQGLGLKISISLSAIGNLIAVIYTSSKVKQAIARQGIIPFSSFFAEGPNVPQGGLILQWICSTIFIIFTPTSGDGYSFIIGLQTYSHVLLSMAVAVGIWRLRRRMQLSIPGWTLDFLSRKIFLIGIPIIFVVINFLILVFGAKPHKAGTIPRYWWPVISFLVYFGAILYWFGFWILQRPIRHKENGGQPITIGQYIGFEIIVHNETDENPPPEMREALLQSRLDGTRRRTQYKFDKWFAFMGKIYVKARNNIGDWFF